MYRKGMRMPGAHEDKDQDEVEDEDKEIIGKSTEIRG